MARFRLQPFLRAIRPPACSTASRSATFINDDGWPDLVLVSEACQGDPTVLLNNHRGGVSWVVCGKEPGRILRERYRSIYFADDAAGSSRRRMRNRLDSFDWYHPGFD
jgi:hypothetical protein